MAIASRALERIKQDLHQHLPDEAIESACRRTGHQWRERKLGPVRTVHLFLLKALWFNTAIEHECHSVKL